MGMAVQSDNCRHVPGRGKRKRKAAEKYRKLCRFSNSMSKSILSLTNHRVHIATTQVLISAWLAIYVLCIKQRVAGELTDLHAPNTGLQCFKLCGSKIIYLQRKSNIFVCLFSLHVVLSRGKKILILFSRYPHLFREEYFVTAKFYHHFQEWNWYDHGTFRKRDFTLFVLWES